LDDGAVELLRRAVAGEAKVGLNDPRPSKRTFKKVPWPAMVPRDACV